VQLQTADFEGSLVSHAAFQCTTTLPLMVADDAHQAAEAAEFWQKLDATVAATADAKKYDTFHTRLLAITALLEEEDHVFAALAKEARAALALIEPPSPMLPLAPAGRVAPLDDDYEAAVIANIHV
jgi:hypothetical protein